MTRLADRVVLNCVFLSLASLALVAIGCGGDSGSGGGSGGKGGSGGVAGSGGAAGSGGQSGAGGAGSGGQSGSGGGSGGQSGSGGGTGGGTGGMDAAVDMGAPEVAPMEVRPDVPAGPMTLTSTAFMMGQMIPQKHKCASSPPGGMNISPPLSWTPGPPGTMSYAVTLNHVASGAAHWAIWNIPPDVFSLAEAIPNEENPGAPAPAGTKQTRLMGFDQFTGFGYLGPCPQQPGTGMYRFTVLAISSRMPTVPAPSGGGNSHVVAAQAALMNARVAGNGSQANLIGTQVRQ